MNLKTTVKTIEKEYEEYRINLQQEILLFERVAEEKKLYSELKKSINFLKDKVSKLTIEGIEMWKYNKEVIDTEREKVAKRLNL